MVNNISGLTPVQSSTSRGREKAEGAERTVDTGNKAPANAEKVELSSEARQLQDIESGLKRLPEVDQERVAHIREALREGSYSVDPARLAAKIVQFELDI